MRVHGRKEFLKLSGLGALTAHLFGKEVDATPAAEVEGVEPVVVDEDPYLLRWYRQQDPVPYQSEAILRNTEASLKEILMRLDRERRG